MTGTTRTTEKTDNWDYRDDRDNWCDRGDRYNKDNQGNRSDWDDRDDRDQPEQNVGVDYCSLVHFGAVDANECFFGNRRPMFCAQDSVITMGQSLRVATKKCMAWSCFSAKSSVLGDRMPSFSVIL